MLHFIRIILICALIAACSTLPTQNTSIVQSQASYQPPQPSYIRYYVQKGDSLSRIAKKFRVSQNSIAQRNRLRPPYTIYINQILYIPNQFVTNKKYINRQNITTNRKIHHKCALMPYWLWPTRGTIERSMSQTGKGSGIKIIGQRGQDIKASAAGTVIFSGVGPKGYQNLIIIQHDTNLLSVYGHNQKVTVRKGQHVQAGQKIAQMGLGTRQRPMLHFEIRCHNKVLEPLSYLPK